MKVSLTTTWGLSKSLNRAQIQQIAIAVGAPLTGNKSQVLDGIHGLVADTKGSVKSKNGLKSSISSQKTLRVLSIDMGVRNLAYAFLEHQTSATVLHVPTLIKWQRVSLDVGQPSPRVSSDLEDMSVKIKEASTATKEAVKESFEPAHLAVHACRLARQFSDLKPTHILIERQRFRSSGQAAVQEWSLRVGILEAMLHANFRMLIEENTLVAEVESVLPARVNKYWFERQDDEPGAISDVVEDKRKVPTAQKAKAAKIALVTAMLQNVQGQTATFDLHPDAKNISNTFLQHKSSNKASGRRQNSSLQLSKLDDLSDSLLQGLAWLHWQENRLKIVEE